MQMGNLTQAQFNAILGIIISFIIIMILFIIYIGFCSFALKKVLRPTKRTKEASIQKAVEQKSLDESFVNFPYEEVWLDSTFGYRLHGRLYINENKTNKFIMVLHGHASNGIGVLVYAKEFLRLGYNVLVPDHRGSGESGGKGHSMGHYEKFDAMQWVDLIEERYESAEFGVFGESMGGATAIMLTALDDRIKFLIEYCAYAHFEEVIQSFIKKRWLFKFFLPGLRAISSGIYSVNFKETAAVDAMKDITVPVLIIHSKGDTLVTYLNAEKLAKANPNAKVITFDDSPHARTIALYREEFVGAIENFIENL